MIVALFYVSFVSFLEKGGKALTNLFFKTYHDLTGLDRAWWFCHHVKTLYILAAFFQQYFFKNCLVIGEYIK